VNIRAELIKIINAKGRRPGDVGYLKKDELSDIAAGILLEAETRKNPANLLSVVVKRLETRLAIARETLGQDSSLANELKLGLLLEITSILKDVLNDITAENMQGK
jgi:hypothetical protein